MVRLNLPSFDYQLSQDGTKIRIFDVIRKKYVSLTPEEWVRQHFVHFLIAQKGYPRALIRIEGGLTYNHLSKRTDIIVYDRFAQPYLVVECKRHDQVLDAKVLRQLSTYNATVRAPYAAVTNGMQHFFFKFDWALKKHQVLTELPEYHGTNVD